MNQSVIKVIVLATGMVTGRLKSGSTGMACGTLTTMATGLSTSLIKYTRSAGRDGLQVSGNDAI